jgi:AcrR family transcriptional regulator
MERALPQGARKWSSRIAAAHRLFLERGYFPITMRAIADTAGVAKTLYLT